ncbi:MAG: DNA mismatch repair endonuclease MutL [Eubacteriales bacterium]|nr:DNA mismatch repair endonuclease MutL [Eubacteriales bacterium]
MKRINLLDKKVFEKIAAGEIVEGPVSVVKELLENSLDAGADFVEVDIENAGMSLIRIIDNGSGIHHEDLEKAFLSHATSKIFTENDLDNISTFGFRGEALASISAVSDIEIVSKTQYDTSGKYLVLSEGSIKEKGTKKILQGTKIEVKNLFFNLPARKKFVSNLNLESGKITELVSNYALGHPDINFILKRDNETIIDTRGYSGWEKRTSYIFKRKKDSFFVINGSNENNFIKGVLFNPQINKNNKKSQIFFVNGRLIKSSLLNNLLDEAYDGLIGKGRFPICVLNIELDPGKIDVNIHPAKTEIRFLDEQELKRNILPIIKNTLVENLSTQNKMSNIAVFESKPLLRPIVQNNDIFIAEEPVFFEKKEKYEPQRLNFHTEVVTITENWLTDLNVIGQFKNTFILAENDKDLFIIDQHVVHERILYEKFIKEVNDNKVTKAPLLAPIPIYLDPQEESILIKNIIVLNDLGFEIENFGPQTYLIRTLPSTLEIENPEEFFTDLLEDLEKSINNSPAKIRDSVITIASCKGAVKANDKLSMEKIKYLLNELSKTENPNTCPHGRPIFKKISINELYRYFQRGGYND